MVHLSCLDSRRDTASPSEYRYSTAGIDSGRIDRCLQVRWAAARAVRPKGQHGMHLHEGSGILLLVHPQHRHQHARNSLPTLQLAVWRRWRLYSEAWYGPHGTVRLATCARCGRRVRQQQPPMGTASLTKRLQSGSTLHEPPRRDFWMAQARPA